MVQKKVANLFPVDYPFETLVDRISKKKLRLDPEFQRKYKWDKDGYERCSKFIESCLMRIPLPMCYLAESTNEQGEDVQDVIDGVQRLTTISRFFDDQFALEGLTVFEELNGRKFSELGKYRSELESTTIRCIVLRKENPRSIVQEIFARLNKGAVELSPQEIRHALFPGVFDSLLSELAREDSIANFKVSRSVDSETPARNNSREVEELVLRYFAFNVSLDAYDGKASKWMDRYMEEKSGIERSEADGMKEAFLQALRNCETVFGPEVFCNLSNRRLRQSYAIYDVQMHCLGQIPVEIVRAHRAQIYAGFKELCGQKDFTATLKVRLSGKGNIQDRRNLFAHVIEMLHLL